jgi:sigma-B regulation protein RsbU (phosphoserine phosphatase)
MARKVQSSLLPQSIPQLEGWEFASLWKPAREVGGDYYDFIPAPKGRLGVVIADVTDKGMPAALFMASTRSIMRAAMPLSAEPADGIMHANQLICQESGEGLFVTLFYALLEPVSGILTYVNAGHNPPLLYRAQAEAVHLGVTGMQLGVDSDSTYGQHTEKLNPGDFVLFYTDGVTEAEQAGGTQFGNDRLRLAISACGNMGAAGILSAIQQAIDEFTGGEPPQDDITLVVARRV